MLAGYRDALALLGVASGLFAATPQLSGSPAVPVMLGASVVGASWISWKSIKRRLVKINREAREDFVLRSDPVPPECQGEKGFRIGLTKDNHLPLDLPNSRATYHGLIIGGSGSGKTVVAEYMMYEQTIRGGGWLFIDAKLDSDQRDRLFHVAKMCGREDDFYIINTSDPALSHTYNPILQGDADEVASRLMALVPSTEGSPGADFYKQSAQNALQVIIGALKATGKVYHFGDLTVLLQSSKALAELESHLIAERGADDADARAFSIFLDQYRSRNKDGVVQIDAKRMKETLGGMAARIAQFAQGGFGHIFNTYQPEIDLTKILKEGKMVYVMLPTMAKDAAALNLGKMILSDLRTAVSRLQEMKKYERPDPPFLAILDEMGSYVTGMPGIARLFEQGRSAGVSLWAAMQTFANLKMVSEDFPNLIVQNTYTKLFFRFASQDADDAAELVGLTKRYAHSVSVGGSKGESSAVVKTAPDGSASDSSSGTESWRETEEFRVTPDQLRKLDIGECVAIMGPRVYHIKTPMINLPNKIPEIKIIRHKTKLPGKEFVGLREFKKHQRIAGSDYEKNYRRYVMVADQGEDATVSFKKTGETA